MNERKMQIGLSLFGAVLFLAATGCGEPIYRLEKADAGSTSVSLSSAHDASFYEWPMTRDGYVVARPPQMAFVTSFEEKLTVPDPVSAELVPWSEEDLDPAMVKWLEQAYAPPPTELETILTIPSSQLTDPMAFDVSHDGRRFIVIDRQGLALYNSEDGTLIGRRELPPEITEAGSPATAVRFCGRSHDLLVASDKAIVRLSRKDGTTIGQAAGVGDPIVQWDVSHDGDAMVIRTASGTLYGGDGTLEQFGAYSATKDDSVHSVSLSSDGSRIAAVVGNQPAVYLQQNARIIERNDKGSGLLGKDAVVATGLTSDTWTDGETLFLTYKDDEGNEQSSSYPMFWKPLQISMTTMDEQTSSLLIVGQRVVSGQEQTVLFDFGPMYRAQSLPQVLDEVPHRIAHNRRGDVVALLDSRGLRLCHRPHWHVYGPGFLSARTQEWVDQKKFAELERLFAVVASQDRLGCGRSSEQLRTTMLEAIAARWRWLATHKPESELLSALEAWKEQGSTIALTADGLQHYERAWELRGGGTAGSVTQQGWQGYEKHLKLAMESLEKAVGQERPPLIAIDKRINAGLEQGEELNQFDPLCRRACELYPGELLPHRTLAFKLTPQWFGEPGDSLSFASSVSKMYEPPHSDFLYMQLVSTMIRYLNAADTVAWKSYDPHRIRRGVQECIRRQSYNDGELWYLWLQFMARTQDTENAKLVLSHLMETTAAPSAVVTHGEGREYSTQMRDMAVELRP